MILLKTKKILKAFDFGIFQIRWKHEHAEKFEYLCIIASNIPGWPTPKERKRASSGAKLSQQWINSFGQ